MRVFHDDDCLGVFMICQQVGLISKAVLDSVYLVCLRILVGRQSVTLKAKLLDVV